ncbi:hypothetical protein PIB30_048327, partial [Stylosanthes scabra]|nr:hypothetical protein [Stylosanthes scabra]
MGISNTTYNSVLYINADFEEVESFKQRSICQLKDVIEKSTYVTIGTVVEFNSWKIMVVHEVQKSKYELKKGANFYSCRVYGDGIQTFQPRYSLHFKVADETGIASFIIYETVGDAFLGVNADNLRSTHLLR